MFQLAFRNLLRRPWRHGVAVAGLAASVAVLACLLALAKSYERGLRRELDGMGLQMMLVPLGCPYDAAARVLKGKTLDNSLPESALTEARHDPAVAVAAPLLMATIPQPGEGRTDLWVGLDQSALALKPWWHARLGKAWFNDEQSVILGYDAAEAEMRSPGDLLFSPETGHNLRVVGVLQQSGTSDDSLFFVPLKTAQAMFGKTGRLTAIVIRLRDPLLASEAAGRLQQIPGAQVVTLTEMMGTFLNLVSAARTLLLSLALVAISVSLLSVFNTVLAAVLERTAEFSVLRALGASRAQVIGLLSLETSMLGAAGCIAGLLFAMVAGPTVEAATKAIIPFAPDQPFVRFDVATLWECVGIGMTAALAAGAYPAWRAGRVPPATALRLL
jgi:putative ABC transport system permease protein